MGGDGGCMGIHGYPRGSEGVDYDYDYEEDENEGMEGITPLVEP